MFSKRGLEPPRFNRLEARDGKRKKSPALARDPSVKIYIHSRKGSWDWIDLDRPRATSTQALGKESS